jgi:hypothetical protein
VVSLALTWPPFASIWPAAASRARDDRAFAAVRDPVPARGTCRIVYRIAEDSRVVHVLDTDHRLEICHRPQL